MRLISALTLAIAAPLALAGASVATASASAQAGDAAQSAAELAKLVHPIDLAVATATEGADRYFVQAMLKQQPTLAELEKNHPGIVAAMYQAGRPFMLEVERRNARKVQEALAEIYRAELTVADMQAAHRFLSSATGQKIVRGMFSTVSMKDLAEVVARNPEAAVEAETISQIQEQTARRMAVTVTSEDEKNSAEFMRTPTGGKMQALTPRMHAKIAEIVNTPHPDLQKQVDSAMEAAALRFAERPRK